MNEEVKNALTGIINTVVDCKDFVLEQAPDVIRQLVAWKTFHYATGSIVGFALVVMSLFLIRRAMRTKYSGSNCHCEAAWFFAAITTAIGHAVWWPCSMLLAKILIAPKVYLLEYAANLM